MIDKVPCRECGVFVLPGTLLKNNGICSGCFKKKNPFWPIELSIAKSAPTEDEVFENRLKFLSEFNKDLKKILEKEIESGNKIAESSAGWPKPESIFILLEKPFLTKHRVLPENIVFRELNDPHYWRAEYEYKLKSHILACRF